MRRRREREGVKGCCVKSVCLSDTKLQLYNVVVDTEETGKQLLQKGGLRRRYTIIPLNKISSHSIPESTTRKAQNLVGSALPLEYTVTVKKSLVTIIIYCRGEKVIRIHCHC